MTFLVDEVDVAFASSKAEMMKCLDLRKLLLPIEVVDPVVTQVY